MLREGEGGGAQPGPRPSDASIAVGGFRGTAGKFPDLSLVNTALGGDFSSVRVHTGPAAYAAAHELGASAYTYRGEVAFKSASPSLDTQIHEATHLAQLGHVPVNASVAGGPSVAALEHEATAVASGHGAHGRKARAATPADGGARDEVLREDDSHFEHHRSGIYAAMRGKTIIADAIMGKTFTAKSDRDYKIDFTFTKAYAGTFPYRAAGRIMKGVYVRIDARFTDLKAGTGKSTRCSKLQLLQVLRNTQVGSDGKVTTADPGADMARLERSGWDTEGAPSRGWRVDSTDTSPDPYYASTHGTEGSATTPATMWDTPGDFALAVNAGKDFYTSAVCLDDSGKRTVVGTVHWGYIINGNGVVAFSPATPAASLGNPIETKDATARWDALPGNIATGITY